MKYLFTALAIMPTLLFTQHSQANTVQICKFVAAEMRKTLPLRKDNVTVIRSVDCILSKPKHRLVHIVEVSIPVETLRQIDVNRDIKPSVLTTYCTDPAIRATLNAYDVDYRYYTQTGAFGGSFLMKSSECR